MKKIKKLKIITILGLMSLIFSSCIPEQRPVVLNENSTPTTATDDTEQTDEQVRLLDQPVNFLQLGTTQSTSTLSLFSDYKDTFLIRGNDLIEKLKDSVKISELTYCAVFNFPGASGSGAKKVAVISARVRAYYSSFLQSKEYFLQLDPNSSSINQGDCLTVSLANKLTSTYGTSNFAFKISDVCPSCNINIISDSIKLYTPDGSAVIDANIDHLNIGLIPPVGTSTEVVVACSSNSSCSSSGYNCCLSGQCVNHGEVKPTVDTSSDKYQVALSITQDHPERIKDYEDIFYVCPFMVPSEPSTSDDGSSDPTQDANDLYTELEQLYNCTTPKIDEFSICTLNYDNASSLMSSSAYPFSAEKDDINFGDINATLSSQNNIVQIDYAGRTVFKEQLFNTDSEVNLPSYITLGAPNNSLTSPQVANIQTSKPADASNDTVSIYYKVDGTCEKLGSSLARCTKYYKQGQSSSPARSSDHASGDQNFSLPNYADTTFNIVVEVADSSIPEGSDTWNLSGSTVVFSSEFPIFDNQEVAITYFVTRNVDQLTKSKELAQSQINEHCSCDPQKDPCQLTPVTTQENGTTTITGYACKYPDPQSEDTPLQETVYISAKTVPQKFFDENGVNYDLGDVASDSTQEGSKFEYTDGQNLKPNNVSSYVGFNEIYGSMNVDKTSPLPPKVVNVEKGTTYDIFVDEGAFSTCLNCGADYFSSMQKLFPNNFDKKGAGYFANMVESRRRTNQSDYNGDDFRFGRACFVPATMIPWTHTGGSDVTTQRRSRLAAQHLLFANGYNKDWYGFDYGSIIGSFDGVKWFAVGNQRRIKAQSNKLYLAVNAYFGDLTINNTFKVMVSEMSSVLNSGSFVTHDSESDGAECQQAHFCSNDEDCITQLGYDYTCQNVSEIRTKWPIFDSNGNEISGEINTSLLSLLGGSNGQVKRCVYRGVGAACEQQNFGVSSEDSYTGSTNPALHACSFNSYCASLNTSNFNNKIARYADSPNNQNTQDFITEKTDTFGLGSRVLGRPYKYYGNETPNGLAKLQLANNNISALCVPGKDPENSSTTEEMNSSMTTTRSADKINNIGRTFTTSTLQSTNYLALCPGTDDEGNYTHFEELALNDNNHAVYAIKNNISSNLLDLDALQSSGLFNDQNDQVSAIGLHKNTCLRSPGSRCFADFECAPNSFIATKFKSVSNFNGEISQAEEEFWEQELVCGNSQKRYKDGSIFPNSLYVITEHKCCRETDKSFTFYTQKHEDNAFKVIDSFGKPLIPGVNMDYNDPQRYSRMNTIYDKLITEPTTYPSLVSASSQPATKLTLTDSTIRQYNSLHLHNQRMCCTGHWVRNFSTGTNGNSGGHKFSPGAMQNISVDTFKPLSWNENHDPPENEFPPEAAYIPIPYVCNSFDIDTTDCEVKNLPENSSEELTYLNWFSKFELLGVPQVLIETNNDVFKPISTEEDVGNGIAADQQLDISAQKVPLENTIKDINTDGVADVSYNGKDYYSATSYENFEVGSGKLKKVFSEDSFNCCIPTGVAVDATDASDSACCSGKVATLDEGITRCCLDDFTDLSVYTNRYISSEGATYNGLPVNDADIDPTTGYVKKEIVKLMGATMCCSGEAAYGNVVRTLGVPAGNGQVFEKFTRRWMYLEEADNADATFNAGRRWNNHVYCVPSGSSTSDGSDGSTSGSSGSVAQ